MNVKLNSLNNNKSWELNIDYAGHIVFFGIWLLSIWLGVYLWLFYYENYDKNNMFYNKTCPKSPWIKKKKSSVHYLLSLFKPWFCGAIVSMILNSSLIIPRTVHDLPDHCTPLSCGKEILVRAQLNRTSNYF